MKQQNDWHPGHLRELTRDECQELLEQRGIGRVAWCDADGAVVLPVNYTVVDGAVLFRTSPHSELARRFAGGPATFQIDEFDEYTESGWSVLVRGRAELVRGEELPESDDRPEPWASGTRNFHVRISPIKVTGRRVLPS